MTWLLLGATPISALVGLSWPGIPIMVTLLSSATCKSISLPAASKTLYVNAAARSGIATGPLAAALHISVSKRRFHRWRNGLRDFARSRPSEKLRSIAIAACAFPAIMFAEEFQNYLGGHTLTGNPLAFLYGFASYVPSQFSSMPLRLLVAKLLLPTISSLLALSIHFIRRPPAFDREAEEAFSKPRGYLDALHDLSHGQPLCLLLDNAARLRRSDLNAVNQLLRWASEDASPSTWPGNFRLFFLTLGLPEGLVLRTVKPVHREVPPLPLPVRRHAAVLNEQLLDEVGAAFSKAISSGGPARQVGAAEWMAYEALLGRDSMARAELKERFHALQSSELLTLLGWSSSVAMPKSHMRKIRGNEYAFHGGKRLAALNYLAENEPQVLGRARLLVAASWLNLLNQEPDWRSWEGGQYRLLSEEAEQLAALTENGDDVAALLRSLEIDPPDPPALAAQLCRLLLVASDISRALGDLERATLCARAALSWSSLAAHSAAALPDSAVYSAVYSAWLCFWLRCVPEDREWLQQFSVANPHLAAANSWQICEAYERYLQGLVPWTDKPQDPGGAQPSLSNLLNYTDLHYEIRRTVGFDDDAFATPDLLVPPSRPEQQVSLFEFLLRLDRIYSASERRADAALKVHVAEERLNQLRQNVKPDCLGDLLLLDYFSARVKGWTAWLKRSADPVANANEQTRLIPEFEDLLETATVLGFRQLRMRASLTLGGQYFIAGQMADTPESKNWKPLLQADIHFQTVLDIENLMDWVDLTPVIYCERVQYLWRADRESALDELFQLHCALRAANFPRQVQIYWHQRARTAFNHSRTADQYRQSAVLHREWAERVGEWPETRAFWRWPALAEEQANAYAFASQASRRADDLEAARRYLDLANGVLAAKALNDEIDSVRQTRIHLNLQAALLAVKLGQADAFRLAIEDCWRKIRPSDESASFVLRQLLWLEEQQAMLGNNWPRDSAGLFPDPVNANSPIAIPSESGVSLNASPSASANTPPTR